MIKKRLLAILLLGMVFMCVHKDREKSAGGKSGISGADLGYDARGCFESISDCKRGYGVL